MNSKTPNITQSELKEALNYDPETGVFTWNINIGTRAKAGNTPSNIRDGYSRIKVNGKQYQAHRLAWLYVHGEWPRQIDHINHIRSDNRLINLREVSVSDNTRNQTLSKKNTSGVCGVHWCKRQNKWRSQINANGKRMTIGYFDKKEDAISARKAAEKEYGYHPNHGQSPRPLAGEQS